MKFEGSKVLVTGGAGFIGSHLVDALVKKGDMVRVVDNLSRGKKNNLKNCLDKLEFFRGDLTDMSVALKSVKDIDFCFHLAAVVGGVNFMTNHPAETCKNILIDHNIIEACRRSKIKKMLYVSTACVYPTTLQKEFSQPPLQEEDALKYGAMPDSYYGWAKLMGEIQCQAYQIEYGMNIAIVRPFNPYGPRESFDPKDSHVIPALIKKAVKKENPFIVWGSGGQARGFTYISDLVEGMIMAMEKSNDVNPINLGTDKATPIKELAELILKLTRHNIPITFEKSKPEGVSSRKTDVSKAKKILEWKQKTELETGLKRTIDWYLNEC
tara:strand:- start:5732 stop:6706 length:975 start_codon:yes stop_codon:yes gene_type:complete